MKNVHWRLKGSKGFSLVDIMTTIAIVGIVAGIAVPQAVDALDRMRLGMAERDVERELQYARLKAVSSNRPMRVRLDCPANGQFRAVELIGTPAAPDAADADTFTAGVARCSETAYPYRPTGADQSRLTRPNNDGPIRYLQGQTTFSVKKTLEFWPDGSVHADAGGGSPWPNVGLTGVTLTLSRKGKTKNIVVNGNGKIFMDR